MNNRRLLALVLAALSVLLLMLTGWLAAGALVAKQSDAHQSDILSSATPPAPHPILDRASQGLQQTNTAQPLPTSTAPSSPPPSSTTPPQPRPSSTPRAPTPTEETPLTPPITPPVVAIRVTDPVTNVFPIPSPIASVQRYTALATGQRHTCALTAAGSVECWGNNFEGELGDGTTISRSVPAVVSGLTSGVQAIAAGDAHTCALTQAGIIRCWGSNHDGQLGNNSDLSHPLPVDVIGVVGTPKTIVAAGSSTCTLNTEGGVQCWGGNWMGLLGDGTTTNRLTPTQVSDLTAGVQAVMLIPTKLCVLTQTAARCWGAHGFVSEQELLHELPNSHSMVGGWSHTCLLRLSGSVGCWGPNFAGELGNGTTTQADSPTDVSHLANIRHITAGDAHTCALNDAGQLSCWGANDSGQLGDGTTTARLEPVSVIELSTPIVALAAGDAHTCALTTDGIVLCWGFNQSGQLGNGIAPVPACENDYECFESLAKGVYIGGKLFFSLLDAISDVSGE